VRERLVAHRVLSSVLERAVGNGGGRTSRPGRELRPDGPVRFVVFDAYWMSGAVRAMLNVAAHLAADREVEVVSLRRSQDEPFFAFPPTARATVLDDNRPQRRRPLLERLASKLPSVLIHPDDGLHHWFTLWSDIALFGHLRSWRTGVVVITRPTFGICAGRFARRGVVVVAQEHGPVDLLPEELIPDVQRHYRQLDAVAVLTNAERESFRRLLGGAPTRVERIPNALSAMPGEAGGARERVVLAAGRLTRAKGFDLLVEAFAAVAARHPDWKLRIHGEGPRLPDLQRLIAERELAGSVEILPPTPDVGTAMARAGIFALSSRQEGFGLVLLEAMSKGTAVVSFDCPTGPREVVTDGRDALLVPAEDVGAFAEALIRLIEDEELRRRLGAAGLETARQYDGVEIGRRWVALLESCGAGAPTRPTPGTVAAVRPREAGLG
jgi:glycosyltransferase involved in cell wall biosynthesis